MTHEIVQIGNEWFWRIDDEIGLFGFDTREACEQWCADVDQMTFQKAWTEVDQDEDEDEDEQPWWEWTGETDDA